MTRKNRTPRRAPVAAAVAPVAPAPAELAPVAPVAPALPVPFLAEYFAHLDARLAVPALPAPAKIATRAPNKNRILADGTAVLPGTVHERDIDPTALAREWVAVKVAYDHYKAAREPWLKLERVSGFRGKTPVQPGFEGCWLWHQNRMYARADLTSAEFIAKVRAAK